MDPLRPSTRFLVPLVLALLVGMGLPADAAGDETPDTQPLGPGTGTFSFHLAKDFGCALAASDMAGIHWTDPLLYATNVADDTCAATTESDRGARSVYALPAVFDIYLAPAFDQPIELVEGKPVTADIWIWTDNAGAVSPRVTLRTGSWTGSADEGSRITPGSLDAQAGGRVWHRFTMDLGSAPATFDAGPVTLSIDLDNGANEARRASTVRAGIGVTPAHKSSFTLPLADQVDDPGDGTPPWPPVLKDASVRPGIPHETDDAQCTTNFVFRDLTTRTLYMGTAAHCVDHVSIGDTSTIGTITATVAWSSFEAPSPVSSADFALLEIPAADEHKVHPAVLGFGGPTALADITAIGTFDKVITFGNSGLRPGPQALDKHEGYVTGTSHWYTSVYTVTPAIFGDSGSGIMTADGAAIGAASTIEIRPVTGRNHFSNIPPVIDWLNDHGWDLELQTWELLDEGVLPAPRG